MCPEHVLHASGVACSDYGYWVDAILSTGSVELSACLLVPHPDAWGARVHRSVDDGTLLKVCKAAVKLSLGTTTEKPLLPPSPWLPTKTV
jgi:hypothetical protein